MGLLGGLDSAARKQLLDAAEAAEFDVLLTTDKNIRYQQNLTGRKIAVVALGNGRWRPIKNRLPAIAAAVAAAQGGSLQSSQPPSAYTLQRSLTASARSHSLFIVPIVSTRP